MTKRSLGKESKKHLFIAKKQQNNVLIWKKNSENLLLEHFGFVNTKALPGLQNAANNIKPLIVKKARIKR